MVAARRPGNRTRARGGRSMMTGSPFRSSPTSAPGVAQGHPEGRNEVEEPRRGLTLWDTRRSGPTCVDNMDTPCW